MINERNYIDEMAAMIAEKCGVQLPISGSWPFRNYALLGCGNDSHRLTQGGWPRQFEIVQLIRYFRSRKYF